MDRLSRALKFYIYERLNSDPLWKGLTVLFSDAQVPGEGEHKILEYIRLQRAQENYDPNTAHCLYGADADLIMLGLSTHEVNFYVLREVFVMRSETVCSLCGQRGHSPKQCTDLRQTSVAASVQFQYISIWRIREFLEIEFRAVKAPFGKDIERLVDDFVFLCFFVGNDFLPQLPSMYIRQGALDSILIVYKKLLPELGGYLTCEGKINYARLNVLLEKIGILEEALLKEKAMAEESSKQLGTQRGLGTKITNREMYLEERKQELEQSISSLRAFYTEKIMQEELHMVKDQLRVEFHQKLSAHMVELRDISYKMDALKHQSTLLKQKKTAKELANKFNWGVKQMLKQAAAEEASKYQDTINFAKEGYKARYYLEKFNITPHDFPEFKSKIRKFYVEGLSWVLEYYYGGCPSWNWYYPYHYSPLSSDLQGADGLEVRFERGVPYRPFEQLMAILPPSSSHALPQVLQQLITNRKSEIADFYPTQSRLDINGQRFAWMGVNLLPFIEEDRLLAALKDCEVTSSPHPSPITLSKTSSETPLAQPAFSPIGVLRWANS
eukprot:TRINITY_DN12928_c0_g1_i7.p1 TRINITY_DN12928_c0_g1~~TRINITY_DN12928_c0_g1_i7.p1  ORF type:complete len:554 (-),score=130.40 TRINITY_DN12928_c0_g1_i7:938-2599(-)